MGARNAVSAASSSSGACSATQVAGASDDQALHVVGDELHRVPDRFTPACRPADRQHGHGQRPGLALLVLGQGGVPGTIEPKAAAQNLGVGEDTEVVPEAASGSGLPPWMWVTHEEADRSRPLC
jgi:hypothetical protein